MSPSSSCSPSPRPPRCPPHRAASPTRRGALTSADRCGLYNSNLHIYISIFLTTYIYKTSLVMRNEDIFIPGDTHGPRSGHLYSRIHRHPVRGHLQEGARWVNIFLSYQKYFHSNENIFRRCLRGSARPQVGSGWSVAGPVRAVCRGPPVQRL